MVVNNFESTLDDGKLMRLLGARKGKTPSPASIRRVDGLTARLEDLAAPWLVYRTFPVDSVDNGGITLARGTRFKSPKIANTMAEADWICCFVATIGGDIDREIDRCMAEDCYADAYVLDAMGSIAAEDVVEQFHRRMENRLQEEDRGVTLRFSPGYCDWAIQQQRDLFALFADADPMDVTLTDTCLMSPRKSVSGIFGILPQGSQSDTGPYNPCNECPKTNCIARRAD
jgi:hypothetical protein